MTYISFPLKAIAKTVLYGGLALSLMYCGDACNVSRPIKNASRVVQGIKVEPTSVNPYRVKLDAIVEEHKGQEWLSTAVVYGDKRYRLDANGRTELTLEQLQNSPLAQEFIDERVSELARQYARQMEQPILESPGFLKRARDYIKEKINEFKK